VPAPETPRRANQGPQFNEAARILREEFPPDGKVPIGMTYKAAWERVVPKTPEGKKPASQDVVADVVKFLGRSS